MDSEISTRFFNGMAIRGYTVEQTKAFKYCGGDNACGSRYFAMFPHLTKPNHANNCVCGQHITRNDYITDGSVVIPTGNCCIKKFLLARRTCELCSAVHKSQKKNRCKDCMNKVIVKVRVVGQCYDCDKKVKGDFYRCFSCNSKRNN